MDIITANLINYYELLLEVRVCAYIGTRIKGTNPSGLLLSAMVRGSPGSRASEDNGSALQRDVPCRWVCASRECASQPFIGCCLCRNIKVTHLSLMKGATTNCEANEWLSLWVRLTSFDSPIPSSYARQKNMCCQKQTLPIDRAKKRRLDPPTQAQFTTYFT